MNTKMISAMKHTKDRMNDPMPVAEMNQLLDVLKTTGATHIEVATVIGHPNFAPYSKQWADAIHVRGMKVTWRCAHWNMEGLYGQPKFVGGNRKPVVFWTEEAVKAVQQLATIIKAGDEWAIYPERTEGIFQNETAWLFDGLPASYAQAFNAFHEACRSVLPAGVLIGLSANNASELLSGWMPASITTLSGQVIIDHYRDGDPALYETEVRAIKAKYGKPVYVQEGAPNRFIRPTRAQADAYFAVNKKLADEGVLSGFGSWSGWAGNPESIVDKVDGVYKLNDSGESLKAWWGGTVVTPPVEPPVEPPQPPTTPGGEYIVHTHGSTTAMVAVTNKGTLWKLSNGKWTKISLPTF